MSFFRCICWDIFYVKGWNEFILLSCNVKLAHSPPPSPFDTYHSGSGGVERVGGEGECKSNGVDQSGMRKNSSVVWAGIRYHKSHKLSRRSIMDGHLYLDLQKPAESFCTVSHNKIAIQVKHYKVQRGHNPCDYLLMLLNLTVLQYYTQFNQSPSFDWKEIDVRRVEIQAPS